MNLTMKRESSFASGQKFTCVGVCVNSLLSSSAAAAAAIYCCYFSLFNYKILDLFNGNKKSSSTHSRLLWSVLGRGTRNWNHGERNFWLFFLSFLFLCLLDEGHSKRQNCSCFEPPIFKSVKTIIYINVICLYLTKVQIRFIIITFYVGTVVQCNYSRWTFRFKYCWLRNLVYIRSGVNVINKFQFCIVMLYLNKALWLDG